MMKKSFTLVEILISISLFSIIILFLYQSLDITTKSNDFYTLKLEDKQKQNNIKKILFLDFTFETNSSVVSEDSDKNSIISFKSTNTYHNPFYENITYMVSKEKNLLRIESYTKFDKLKLDDNFFDTSYIDILDSNITKFKVKLQNKKKIIYIQNLNKNKIIVGL